MDNKQIEAFLLKKYPGDGKPKAVRDEIGRPPFPSARRHAVLGSRLEENI